LLSEPEFTNLLSSNQPSMSFKILNPETLAAPRGYSNGILCEPGGRLLFVAGQIGWDAQQKLVAEGFTEQFDQALANVLAVVHEAGGRPEEIARLMIYVTNRDEYVANIHAIGKGYRARMGKHFPAMALLEVKGLLEPAAKVEIEAIAVLRA
jgi:enamine deaminase RidA (YjgF/YER057c/UK114 family)